MTSQTPKPRGNAKNNNGMKMMIMAASLAITLGGWGALAANQAGNVAASQPGTVAAASVNTAQSTNQRTTTQLRQVNSAPSGQSQIITRTRSSR